MVDFITKEHYGFEDLLEIMRILRAPGGCVWDREQTHQSIRRDFLEETYEACEAIDENDPVHLCEELGDVLLQVVFHADIAKDEGAFTISEVCDGICKKLIYRHPHVFGEVEVSSSAEVLENWDALKRTEKQQQTQTDTLRSVSKSLPALWRAEKLQHKAAKAGLRLPSEMAYARVQASAAALKPEMSAEQLGSSLGDLLFSAVGLAEAFDLDCEALLTAASERFIARFAACEDAGIDIAACSDVQKDALLRGDPQT